MKWFRLLNIKKPTKFNEFSFKTAQFFLFDVVLRNKRDIVSTPEHFSLPKDEHKRRTEIWTCFKRKLAQHRIFRVHISEHWSNIVRGGKPLSVISNNHSSLAVRGGRANNSLLIARRRAWSIFKVKKNFSLKISSTHWKTYTRQWPETFPHRKDMLILLSLDNSHNTKWFQ